MGTSAAAEREASSRGEPVAFVHVEANVGSASGGHSALRIEDRVYHYQVGGDRLRLHREDWPAFAFRYGTLENRPLHLAWVPLDDERTAALRDHLDRLFLAGRRAHREREALARDVAWLEARAGLRAGVPSPGAGLIDSTGTAEAPALALAANVARRLGSMPPTRSRARDIRDARNRTSLEAALAALRAGAPLADAARIEVPHPPLSARERSALSELQREIEDTIVRTLAQTAAGRPETLWLLLARHRAASESLARGRLTLLDPTPPGGPRMTSRDFEGQRSEFAALARVLEESVAHARTRAFHEGVPGDRALGRLEHLASRSRELARALDGGHPPRLSAGPIGLPDAARDLAADGRPGTTPSLEDARRALRQAEADLARAEHYDLFDHNCVTALAAAVEAGLGGATGSADAFAVRAATDDAFGFVPFVQFDRLTRRLPAARIERLPARRARWMAERPGWPGRLRESNTLTSRLYLPRHTDGSFLFFTDRPAALRPVLGALNLAWALGDGAVGLLTAPFDRGRRVERAARGALFSLPELVFVNLRKGSFDARSLGAGRPAPPTVPGPSVAPQ